MLDFKRGMQKFAFCSYSKFADQRIFFRTIIRRRVSRLGSDLGGAAGSFVQFRAFPGHGHRRALSRYHLGQQYGFHRRDKIFQR